MLLTSHVGTSQPCAYGSLDTWLCGCRLSIEPTEGLSSWWPSEQLQDNVRNKKITKRTRRNGNTKLFLKGKTSMAGSVMSTEWIATEHKDWH